MPKPCDWRKKRALRLTDSESKRYLFQNFENVDRRHFENEVPPELEIKRIFSVNLKSARSTAYDIVCGTALDGVSVLVNTVVAKMNQQFTSRPLVRQATRLVSETKPGVRRGLHVKIWTGPRGTETQNLGQSREEQITRTGKYKILLGEFAGGTVDSVHDTVRSTVIIGDLLAGQHGDPQTQRSNN